MRVRSTCRRNSCPRPAPAWAPSISPGDVGHHQRAVHVDLNDAEVGDLRRERVVGDLRAGAARRGSAACSCRRWVCRTGRRRQSPSARGEPAPFAFAAGRVFARRLVGGSLEARVSFAAGAAAGGDHLVRRRSARSLSTKSSSASITTVPGGTRMIRSSALRPWHCEPMPWSPRSARQCLRWTRAARAVDARLGHDDHAAAVAAVAAVGSAAGDVLLAAEADAAVAAAAGFDFDGDAIDEHGSVES